MYLHARVFFLFGVFFFLFLFKIWIVRVRLAVCKVVNEEAVSFISALFSKGSQSLSRSRISFVAL
jgi:hypothetical protein